MTVDLTDAERRFIRNEAGAFLESTEGEDDFAELRAVAESLIEKVG